MGRLLTGWWLPGVGPIDDSQVSTGLAAVAPIQKEDVPVAISDDATKSVVESSISALYFVQEWAWDEAEMGPKPAHGSIQSELFGCGWCVLLKKRDQDGGGITEVEWIEEGEWDSRVGGPRPDIQVEVQTIDCESRTGWFLPIGGGVAGSATVSECILADMQTPAGPAAVLATPGPGTSEAADAANTEDVAPIAGLAVVPDTADTTENAEPLAGPAPAPESSEAPWNGHSK